MKKKLSKHEQNCEHGVSEWNKDTNNCTDKFLLTFIMKISNLSNSSQGSNCLRVASVWAAIGERVKATQSLPRFILTFKFSNKGWNIVIIVDFWLWYRPVSFDYTDVY